MQSEYNFKGLPEYGVVLGQWIKMDDNTLRDKLGIEESVLYIQSLNRALAKLNSMPGDENGSLVIININRENNYKPNLENALKGIMNNEFDKVGNIRDMDGNNLIFVAHKLKDTKESLDRTLVNITESLGGLYPKDKYNVYGILYDGTGKLTAEQAIEKLKSELEQLV